MWKPRVNHSLIGVALSGLLVGVGLWQLEMMIVQQSWNFSSFHLPFGFTLNWADARDVFCGLIFLGWGIVVVLIAVEKEKVKE